MYGLTLVHGGVGATQGVVGEFHWSTYSFIVNMQRKRLEPERSKKLVFVLYKKRLIRKMKRVDDESEAIKRDDGEVEAEQV